ncbi:hypothetical protein BAE44_0024707, partial [Dichanthelium oligosanthes]
LRGDTGADPGALQAGLNWACGQGHADCTAIQPGEPCYKQNNMTALASYAYNDYYQQSHKTSTSCSFNGTATTTTARAPATPLAGPAAPKAGHASCRGRGGAISAAGGRRDGRGRSPDKEGKIDLGGAAPSISLARGGAA